jgi:hypothetical protein
MNDWRRNGTRNPRRTWRRIEVWTMTVVAVRMNATIFTKQWTIVKVAVPMTTPVALMEELGSMNTNLVCRSGTSKSTVCDGSCQYIIVPDIQRNKECKNPKSNALFDE